MVLSDDEKRAAEIVRAYDLDLRSDIANAFCLYFEQVNPLFWDDRFLNACGLDEVGDLEDDHA